MQIPNAKHSQIIQFVEFCADRGNSIEHWFVSWEVTSLLLRYFDFLVNDKIISREKTVADGR